MTLHTYLEYSLFFYLVPAEAPQNVSLTLRNDSLVTLQWNEIPRSAVNGKLIGYVIIIRDTDGQVKINKTVPPSQLSIKINTLISHKQYEGVIYGLTRTGAGKEYSFNFFTANGGMFGSFYLLTFDCFVFFI